MDGRFIGNANKKRFSFSQFLSLYMQSYNENNKVELTAKEILQKWYEGINSTDKYFSFHNNEEEYNIYMKKCASEQQRMLQICPSCDHILLWFSNGKKFDVTYPTPNFRKILIDWMK